eukprot:560775-Pyramimonas_sp.AAC.1
MFFEIFRRGARPVLMDGNFHEGMEKISAEWHKYRDPDVLGSTGLRGEALMAVGTVTCSIDAG